MAKSVPIQGRSIARSASPHGRLSVTRRRVNVGHDQEFASRYSSDDHSEAKNGSLLLAVGGYSSYWFALLFVWFWAIYHFGQAFWFFSIVTGAHQLAIEILAAAVILFLLLSLVEVVLRVLTCLFETRLRNGASRRVGLEASRTRADSRVKRRRA
jgi:hypothetical protein